MPVIYRTPQGNKNVNLSQTPFDAASIVFPNISNTPYVLTPDLATGNALTMQPTGQANASFAFSWNGDSFVDHASADSATGNVLIYRYSNSDNTFLTVFNSYNLNEVSETKKFDHMTKAVFNIKYWNSKDTSQYAVAEGCFFTNQAPFQVNRGSNNAQETEQWSYQATDWYRSPSAIQNDPADGQDASSIVGALGD